MNEPSSISYDVVRTKFSEPNYIVSSPEYLFWLMCLKESSDPLFVKNQTLVELMIAYLRKIKLPKETLKGFKSW